VGGLLAPRHQLISICATNFCDAYPSDSVSLSLPELFANELTWFSKHAPAHGGGYSPGWVRTNGGTGILAN
jgi:hypothetical protein